MNVMVLTGVAVEKLSCHKSVEIALRQDAYNRLSWIV